MMRLTIAGCVRLTSFLFGTGAFESEGQPDAPDGERWGEFSERAFDVSGEPLNPVPSRMKEEDEPPKGLGHGRENV